ncbi:MAG: cation transporter [Desulfuromonadaceae bacterium]|nr:cation transporter [Geobacteraceae bacterium]
MPQSRSKAKRSFFSIPHMDCPAEEQMVRMALSDVEQVHSLDFDLSARSVTIVHQGDAATLLDYLHPLGLGTALAGSDEATAADLETDAAMGDAAEARTLKILLGINGGMFILEIIVGFIAQSTGLIADSVDMFADAAVYGLALFAVGKAAAQKMRAARFSGWIQFVLALGVLTEVARRVVFGSEPISTLMILMGTLALVANVASLVLVAQKRDRGVHMKASYIFSANDVIANLGLILAGALVAWSGSAYPDLIIGTIIGIVVLSGAYRILKLK